MMMRLNSTSMIFAVGTFPLSSSSVAKVSFFMEGAVVASTCVVVLAASCFSSWLA